MAAGKPIISTAIHDVVRDYSESVSIISTSDEFSEAIDMLLFKAGNVVDIVDYEEILEKTSWDATAEKMQSLLKNTVKA